MRVIEGFPVGVTKAPASGAAFDMRQVVRVERRRAIREPPVPKGSAPESNQSVHEGNIAAGLAIADPPRLNILNSADPVNGARPTGRRDNADQRGRPRAERCESWRSMVRAEPRVRVVGL